MDSTSPLATTTWQCWFPHVAPCSGQIKCSWTSIVRLLRTLSLCICVLLGIRTRKRAGKYTLQCQFKLRLNRHSHLGFWVNQWWFLCGVLHRGELMWVFFFLLILNNMQPQVGITHGCPLVSSPRKPQAGWSWWGGSVARADCIERE